MKHQRGNRYRLWRPILWAFFAFIELLNLATPPQYWWFHGGFFGQPPWWIYAAVGYWCLTNMWYTWTANYETKHGE